MKDGGPSDQQQEDRSVADGLGIRDRVPVWLRPPKGELRHQESLWSQGNTVRVFGGQRTKITHATGLAGV